ncbi:MAG: DUF1819 family protein [Anaerolineales bacterium]|nr:DUF1819 family protein [Anaerolineales bacterium]
MTDSAQENGQRRYRVNGVIKGAAVVEEMRTLLEHWTPEEGHLDLQRRVLGEDLLGKATATRARDMIMYVFRPRLLTPTDAPARRLKLFLELNGNPGSFRELLLLYEARTEAVLYDFITAKYWPARAGGELWLRTTDALDFLDEGRRQGLIEGAWSESTRRRTAHALLAALTAFGYLSDARAERREILPYRPSDFIIAYLAHDLHFAGQPDTEVIAHPDWNLFGLDANHLQERLDALGPTAGLLLQRAGSVVRISWSHLSMEAMLHALVG